MARTVQEIQNTSVNLVVLVGFFKRFEKVRNSKKWSSDLAKNVPPLGVCLGDSESVIKRQSTDKKSPITPRNRNNACSCPKKGYARSGRIWSFVYSKAFKRWVWVALCRRTPQIVAYFIGDRSEKSCRKFWSLVPPRKCRCFSDFWEAYASVIDNGKHQMVGKESPCQTLEQHTSTTNWSFC